MTPADSKSPRQSGSPPAVTVVEITDPTTANDTIEVLAQDVVKLGSQRLRARRVTVRLEGGVVLFHRTDLRVRTRTSVNRELVAYGACGPHAEGSANGLPIRPGTMLAVEPGAEVVFVSEPGYESVFALLGPDEIEAHLRGRGSVPIVVEKGKWRNLLVMNQFAHDGRGRLRHGQEYHHQG
jgi:hypothetical protein